MRRILPALVLTLLLPLVASAGDPGAGWAGDFSFAFALTRGNSDTTSVSASFHADRWLDQDLQWLNSATFLTGDTDGDKTAESMGLGTRLQWSHTPDLFSYYELPVMRDTFKDYRYRFQPGAGIGYKMLKEKDMTLDLTGGLAWVLTEYESTGDTDDYLGVKLGNLFAWKFSPTAELKQSLGVTFDGGDFGRYFARFEAGVAASLTKEWAVTVTFIDTYDSDPVDPSVQKNDIQMLAGISKKF
jgi:putative salt-induced outer membrane protein